MWFRKEVQEVSWSVTMKSLIERIEKIEERNAKVEYDKAWETSWTRRVLLVLFTYLAIGLYLWAIHILHAWMNAIVPAVGFMISTLTMPFFKNLWVRSRRLKK